MVSAHGGILIKSKHYVCVCVCVRMCVRVSVSVFAGGMVADDIYMCIYIYMFVYIYMCIYIYIFIISTHQQGAEPGRWGRGWGEGGSILIRVYSVDKCLTTAGGRGWVFLQTSSSLGGRTRREKSTGCRRPLGPGSEVRDPN